MQTIILCSAMVCRIACGKYLRLELRERNFTILHAAGISTLKTKYGSKAEMLLSDEYLCQSRLKLL